MMETKEALKILNEGVPVQRVKRSKLTNPLTITIDEAQNLNYNGARHFFNCARSSKKNLNVSDVLEIRQGYSSDGLHRAAKHYKFQKSAPENRCFSIIFKHPKFVSKSIDFVTMTEEEKANKWINALKQLISQSASNPMTFDEKLWILRNFRRADLDKNGEVGFDELWKLLKKLNLQLSQPYVQLLFKDTLTKHNKRWEMLNESEFIELFGVLTDLPEYRTALRLANSNDEEFLDAGDLLKFLIFEQGFKDLDMKKAEAIIDFCETGSAENSQENTKNKVLTVNGFRRLLQSRWGNILKPLQVRGNATVEGYISALRKGARLLELDIFDGDYGEPIITHKRTFISAISLRNALKCIAKYAFQINPYPVILTLENHVGTLQQKIMADIFEEILGDTLYVPSKNAGQKPLPSPNELKNKILLRGKTSLTNKISPLTGNPTSNTIGNENNQEDEFEVGPDDKKRSSPIDPYFGRLIALPSVKLSNNLFEDIQEHPKNGSPSLSESKVVTYLESGGPIFSYTSARIIKSYPRGIRQDSSNMSPIPSWLCGIQSVAMNMQTAGEDMDLVNGFFQINGKTGYVLKPEVLLNGLDPRHKIKKIETTLSIGVICGQYLPKPEPSKDIIDPFISLEIFGIPIDETKKRTRAIKDNGFNPVWNENFSFPLHCPELAILRFSVKDFDSTTSDDFIGEYSVPVSSIRQGYSHIRLNTGFEHSPDDAASLFVRIAFENFDVESKK